MSVKNFKFVSPGVFINEIDNSFIPRTAPPIGPVVVGRAQRGLAMQPVKVDSYSKFVEMFGDTVPGGGNSDIYREGNMSSPMYGGYAAKAFLRGAVAPVTFVRLLGEQTAEGKASATAAAQAGWQTTKVVQATALGDTGGAWGLWVFKSGSRDGGKKAQPKVTASLGAIIYAMNGTALLSGSVYGSDPTASAGAAVTTASVNTLINSNNGIFTVTMKGSGYSDTFNISLDDTNESYIRKQINTNPTLVATDGDGTSQDFYPTTAEVNYFVGETFDQDMLDKGLASSSDLSGFITKIALSGSTTDTPAYMKKLAHTEPRTSWIIGQDLKNRSDFEPYNMQRLFRFIGRGHGEWLQKNVKVSISNVRQSNNSATDYGSFSVILRDMRDTDNDVVILERFDECTLDPSSPNFVARKIGDRYQTWDSKEKRLREYGEYENQSKFVYIQLNSDVEAGAIDAVTLPFGYYGPPKFKNTVISASAATSHATRITADFNAGTVNRYIELGGSSTQWGIPSGTVAGGDGGGYGLTGSRGLMYGNELTGAGVALLELRCQFPEVRIRHSASAGGLTDPRNAYFGMQTTRTSQSTIPVAGVGEYHRAWDNSWVDDPVASAQTGVDAYAYIMSLDDVISGSNGIYYWASGSRARSQSKTGASVSASYKDLLDAGYNKFTVPLWGGVDGFDITKPDPTWNGGMTPGVSTEENSYIYHTWAKAMDTVADPEAVDMNMLVAPGLTNNQLTEKAINICSARGDAMALIDLADVYLPSCEGQRSTRSTKASRLKDSPTTAATNLRNRKLDSSYGATFYPWVQTRDEGTGRLLWVPPSVAMMGVLASSEKKSQLWFAPAGFNRGGLTEGAAGIPVLSVTQRLTSKERDTLYEASINPIASFPSTGIVVFGQKTLQERQSALDRINVRRLVIYLKKQISIISSRILFEQNVQATWNRFRSLVEPFLANVKTTFGITDYRLILDESTTTPDLIDQNIMYAKIMVKPARAIEFIAIDFVIASTGASFDD